MTDVERDARIISLEASVAELREELAQLRRPQRRSMKATGVCPECGGRSLLQFRQESDIAKLPYALVLYKKLRRGGNWQNGGVLEAFACRACLLVEWHAVTLDDCSPNGTDVIEREAPEDPESSTGPFR